MVTRKCHPLKTTTNRKEHTESSTLKSEEKNIIIRRDKEKRKG